MGDSKRVDIFWDIYSYWYDTLKDFAPYQDMISDVIKAAEVKKEQVYLDLGCGTGVLSSKLTACNGRVLALDNSEGMLKIARSKEYGPGTVKWIKGDINNFLNFASSSFDRVYSTNVISYAENPNHIVKEMYRILKYDGTVVVTTPKRRFNLLKLFFHHLNKKGFIRTIAILPPLIMLGLMNIFIFINVHKEIYNFFDEHEIRGLFRENNFRILELRPTYAGQAFLVLAKKG